LRLLRSYASQIAREMARQWLIVADDLTGAADCAIAFARAGQQTAVHWRGRAGEAEEAVLAFDANSRNLSASEAAGCHAKVLRALHRPGTHLFKKIDSTLRGQPAAELAATLGLLRHRDGRAFGIMAPAFPATGRITEYGRIRVNGQSLEETETWRRDHSYANACLPDVLTGAGIRSKLIGLDTVRSGEFELRRALIAAAGGAEVAICDATSDDDLFRIAAAGFGLGAPIVPGLFWIGTGGLAHALAIIGPRMPASPTDLSGSLGGTLVVVGSLAAASRAAASALAGHPGLRHVPVQPDLLLDESADAQRERFREGIIASLQRGEDVLVEVAMGEAPDLARGPRITDALGRFLAPAAPYMGALTATGGETAAALLAHFGVHGLRLLEEIEAGVSLGVTLGAIKVPVVTKAGAFGDEGTLTRVVHRLRAINKQGFVA
jgi:uncharacterized protein YgbK (DUF1537 family)